MPFELQRCQNVQFPGAREDLEEMLGNVMDNACRWADGTVAVEVGISVRELRIAVQDDGPGIPDDRLAQVLERGVRLDQRPSSSGLSLAIVSDIATSYGGYLELENTGKGLRVVLRFPVSGDAVGC